MKTKASIIVFVCYLDESAFFYLFLFPYLKKKKECIVWELLLTILFSDFVSFGFSTTDIVI